MVAVSGVDANLRILRLCKVDCINGCSMHGTLTAPSCSPANLSETNDGGSGLTVGGDQHR